MVGESDGDFVGVSVGSVVGAVVGCLDGDGVRVNFVEVKSTLSLDLKRNTDKTKKIVTSITKDFFLRS